MLDLYTYQRPGNWIQQVVCAPVRFTKVMTEGQPVYTDVEIYHEGNLLTKVTVEIVG